MRLSLPALVFAALLPASSCLAQAGPPRAMPPAPGMPTPATPNAGLPATPNSGLPATAIPPATTPWAQANDQSMQAMQQAMMNASAGASNEDEAFVRGMLPHHGGAIAMARVELQYGHDPELKRLAARIVTTQQAEIREMSAWLARHRQQ